MAILYVIKLNQFKYYIGITKNTVQELDNYVNYLRLNTSQKTGIDWIDKYRPLHMYDIKQNPKEHDLKRFTIRYMEVYGINHVRGWKYTRINLTIKENMSIMRDIINNTPFCLECKREVNRLYNCEYCMNKKIWECPLCGKEDLKERIIRHEERRHNIRHYGYYKVIPDSLLL